MNIPINEAKYFCGIDPGMRRGGMALLDESGKMVNWADVAIPKRIPADSELLLHEVGDYYQMYFESFKVAPAQTYFAIETFHFMGAKSFSKNVRGVMSLAYYLVGKFNGMPANPLAWRKATTGNQHAKDYEVAAVVEKSGMATTLKLPGTKAARSHVLDAALIAEYSRGYGQQVEKYVQQIRSEIK